MHETRFNDSDDEREGTWRERPGIVSSSSRSSSSSSGHTGNKVKIQ